MKKLLSIGLIIIFIFINANKVQADNVTEKNMPNEVDVVLFWGQSNMVGTSGRYDSEDKKDTRDLSSFIDSEILKQYKQMDYVSVQVPSGVAYEYKINELGAGYLREINANTKYFGEDLTYENGYLYSYNENTKQWYDFKSLYQSYGTNMIPQFCKTYYERTGRNIVVVMAARGGQPIGNFLPSNDPGYSDKEYKYLYESIKYKYENALKHLSNRGIKVKNKFYVVCQGENDANSKLANSYYKTFLKVHQNLKKDLGLKFGVINTTGHRINRYNEDSAYVGQINKAQRKLINNNADIILGSNLGYDVYNKKIKEAFCLEKSYNTGSSKSYDNSIHFNSATLCQMGKSSAIAAIKKLRTAVSDQAPHFQISVNNNKIYYEIKDGTRIDKYRIKEKSTGKYILNKNIISNNQKELKKEINTLNLDKNESKKYSAIAYDDSKNIIVNQFLLKKNKNGNYKVQNAPELYSTFTEGNTVNLFFTESKAIYIKNLEQSKFKKKIITKIKNNEGKDFCKISVNLNEMTYKNGAYYVFVKAYDTTSNKLYSQQRIKLTKINS